MCHMWGARDSLEALKPHHKSDKGKDVISLVFSSKKTAGCFKITSKTLKQPQTRRIAWINGAILVLLDPTRSVSLLVRGL